jgi:hypothetical protein
MDYGEERREKRKERGITTSQVNVWYDYAQQHI